MDSLTHLVLGHVLGTAAAHNGGAAAYWGLLVGNSLPDIDVPAGYLVGRGWQLHRLYTHTIPGVLVLSAAAGGAIALAGGVSWPAAGLWTLAGCAVHVGLDCCNLFGARPLWPLSRRTVGWGTLFIVDLGLLGIGVAASAAEALHIAGAAGWGAALMALYLALRFAAWWRLRAKLGAGAALVPLPAGWRWLRDTPQALEYGTLPPWGGRLTVAGRVEKGTGPAVSASQQAPAVAAFLARARYPYARVEQVGEGWRVVWRDMARQVREGLGPAVTVELDAALRIVRAVTGGARSQYRVARKR